MAESSDGYEDVDEIRGIEGAGRKRRDETRRDEKKRVKWKRGGENEQVPYCIAVSTVRMHCNYAQW